MMNKQFLSIMAGLVLSIGLALTSCSSDDDGDWLIDRPDRLYQTVWEGTLQPIGDTAGEAVPLTISFDRKDKARIVYENMLDTFGEKQAYDISYSLDGRMIFLNNFWWAGRWSIVETTTGRLVLELYDSGSYRMDLKRKR